MLRAQTLVTLKDYQSALFDVNRLIEINPSSEVYRNLHARLKTQLVCFTPSYQNPFVYHPDTFYPDMWCNWIKKISFFLNKSFTNGNEQKLCEKEKVTLVVCPCICYLPSEHKCLASTPISPKYLKQFKLLNDCLLQLTCFIAHLLHCFEVTGPNS